MYVLPNMSVHGPDKITDGVLGHLLIDPKRVTSQLLDRLCCIVALVDATIHNYLSC